MISLAALKPQEIEVKIMGLTENGEAVVIPMMTLSYLQWQEATVGLTPPVIPMRRTVPDSSKPPVDVPNPDDPKYQRDKIEYDNAVKCRRVAKGLEGAGMTDLQGKTLDEQIKEVQLIDAGVLNVLYSTLEGLALRRTGAWFQRKPEPLP